MSYRDREINFISIDGTAVATGSDQEDSIDLSNYGVSMGNFMGLRIWRVEFDSRVTENETSTSTTARTNSVTLRTITSGSSPPDHNDDGVIAQRRLEQLAITTSGASTVIERNHGGIFPRGLLIVTDRLYQYYDNNSGGTVAYRTRIWATLDRMSESDWREAWEVWRRA